MRISINSVVLCKLVDGGGFEFPQSAKLADLGTRAARPGHRRWADLMLAPQQVGERHVRTFAFNTFQE
jgi:hypothetical protein